MDRLFAFEKALNTWARWVEEQVDPMTTKVFFLGPSPTHFNASHWGNNEKGDCKDEMQPLLEQPNPGDDADLAKTTVERVWRSMSKPVGLLNVTGLSSLRNDAHPSLYSSGAHRGMDRSHWCVSGVPDTWNHLLYAELMVRSNTPT
ncbi:Trichome birefringence-like family [Parasponia andersonii]|uniref:Trichome birefringence-like family n=1 Tax=Parasponia andersonii TaxID=3476 RepID=A0A2P5D7U9_PARAD|nr:Trichome birefringence-like family [Parasponia andersonii]